ncbi:MAG TPA: hypothetical protein VFG91_13120 [Woeseiaceae bacterium]|nr:hypothetical protein [Woeseiaceae bacterium]
MTAAPKAGKHDAARARKRDRLPGRAAPVAGIEMFNIADNFWTLTPLIIFAVAIWGGFLLAHAGFAVAARLAGLAIFIVLPASLAVLAITRFAQEYLAWLLAEGRDIEALKLLTRCFLEDPAFRPLPADRAAVLDIARRFHRDDLLQNLV